MYSELSDILMAWVRRIITDGFDFAGLRYSFLAFSSSQLQDHGVWMYCNPTADTNGSTPTAQDIRARAGTLDSLRVPAKWAARLGQCFSTTADTIELAPNEVRLSGLPPDWLLFQRR